MHLYPIVNQLHAWSTFAGKTKLFSALAREEECVETIVTSHCVDILSTLFETLPQESAQALFITLSCTLPKPREYAESTQTKRISSQKQSSPFVLLKIVTAGLLESAMQHTSESVQGLVLELIAVHQED